MTRWVTLIVRMVRHRLMRVQGSLRGRLSLVLTGLAASLLLSAGAVWLHETRQAIHEEVEAATRVAEQWLNVLIPETLADDTPNANVRLIGHVRALGRLRANRLEIIDADGHRLYASPEPTYKAGRFAPEWFSHWIAPEVMARHFAAGAHQVRLLPDTSRAVLDAWDKLIAGTGWAVASLLLIAAVTHRALNRALAPLGQIDAALQRSAGGLFDRRLPEFSVRELDRLAHSYNRLAESLDQTRAHNARLEESRLFGQVMQQRLARERTVIARELHDELGQNLTAVRAIAGAIMQRTEHQPHLHGSAQAIVAVTGQMQDEIRSLLERLRTMESTAPPELISAITQYCARWSSYHPEIKLDLQCCPLQSELPASVRIALLRVLQESLTNVARHAQADTVQVRLEVEHGGAALRLEVEDNGRGLRRTAHQPGLGLVGMRERVEELHGSLAIDASSHGGVAVRVRVPVDFNQLEAA